MHGVASRVVPPGLRVGALGELVDAEQLWARRCEAAEEEASELDYCRYGVEVNSRWSGVAGFKEYIRTGGF
jgi:hypothetical protein